MRVTVIVSTRSQYPMLSNTLPGLLEIAEDRDFDVVYVSDACPYIDSLKLLQKAERKLKHFRLISLDHRRGYGGANNVGAMESLSDYLLFLNDDIIVSLDEIRKLTRYISKHPTVGAVQGLLLYPQTHRIQSAGHVFADFVTKHTFENRFPGRLACRTLCVRQALTTAYCVVTRDAFREAGGFNEFYWNAWEGLELTLKIGLGGKECHFYPDSLAYHIRGATRDKMIRDETQQVGYFWSRWADQITNDLPDLLRIQLPRESLSVNYLVVDCSGYLTWPYIIDAIRLRTLDTFRACLDCPGEIGLLSQIPRSIMNHNGPLLFLTTNFLTLLGNRHAVDHRRHYHDLVMDLCGNVCRLSDI